MAATFLLGLDIGSSSVKAALLDINTGKPVATAFSPDAEMVIHAPHAGFAEQDPETWWSELLIAIKRLKTKTAFTPESIAAIGISYQMHGLVCLDENNKPLRPSIIWCDSRAVEIGNTAFEKLGTSFCLDNFLNSPGNFTASKLAWVKANEPEIYNKIKKVCLPGDYIAYKLTGALTTTISGLSEGIMWNFKEDRPATELLDYYGIGEDLLATLVPVFGEQGRLNSEAAAETGLISGIPVSYRSGDQPNNAFSLNVLEPGEIAATAGTSGVVYGITDLTNADPQSRVNAFVHVNHSSENPRYGILMCVNGTGSLNSWLRKSVFHGASYDDINVQARQIKIGSDGLKFYPFGNGAERVLANKNPGAMLEGLQFNLHHQGHMARAAQEGIVFALNYGMEVMKGIGMEMHTIRAGYANMFLSDVFASTFANTTGCIVELYNTDGAVGAARGAGIGAGIYPGFKEAFSGMEIIRRIEPEPKLVEQTTNVYNQWQSHLSSILE